MHTRSTSPCAVQGSQIEALTCLCMLARLHGIAAEPLHLAHQLGVGASQSHSSALQTHEWVEEALLVASQTIGLNAQKNHTRLNRLAQTPLPAIAKLANGQWVLIAACNGTEVLLHGIWNTESGAEGLKPKLLPLAEFGELWANNPNSNASGHVFLFTSRASELGKLARFDFTWFIPSIVKHRKLLGEVLLASVFLQLFAMVSPLFFQVVMDKVLLHQGYSTLNVIAIGLLVVMGFESVLNLMRTYVFSHTTSRLDVELGSRLFRHMLALPLAYFQARRVGDTVARVRELENIRAFLTGQALTLVLDVLFSSVFIGVMLFYSARLTLIVLASIPLYALVSLLVVPTLKHRLEEKFQRGADSQALLVEAVTGVQTIKASALEPQIANRWDDRLAAYVASSLRTTMLAASANEAVGFIGKLVSLGTLWFGAHLVMEGKLTLGMFIAFNMFAGRVAQPIIRMAQLWTEFQQVGISVARLGDVLNCPTEAPPSHAAQLPALSGRITFDQVNFHYRPDGPAVLSDIRLDIHPGQIIGIIGRSGSGKSTLTKLVQRLYVPSAGKVLIDGIDISLIDAAQLRRQIGVVLQDNWLFNRSVRDNIAMADPGAPMQDVVAAAKLAGAHEFISELPQGYDTPVGEQGASLSGGQRQRIAIARALFGNPKILIFDEATSALDYESEAIIQRNMAAICKGRTVLIIAHRLSAVRQANGIVVLDKGRIAEGGAHDALLARNGLYAHLWRTQTTPPAGTRTPEPAPEGALA